MTHALEQIVRSLEIDAVALVELLLGLARDDRGEMEDNVWLVGDQLVGLAFGRQITGRGGDLELGACGRRWCHHIKERQIRNLGRSEAAIFRELLRELLADHAGAANNEDFHACVSDGHFARTLRQSGSCVKGR